MPARKFKPLKPVELLAAIGVIALFAACGVVYYCTELLSTDRCFDNVYINGQLVGGMSLTDIREKFKDAEIAGQGKIVVAVDGSRWIISLKDISARFDVVQAEQEAMSLGRSGSSLERLSAIFNLRVNPRQYDFNLLYDENALDSQIERIYKDVNVSAQDAQMEFQPEASEPFVITNEVAGTTIDKAELLDLLQQHLKQGKFDTVTLKSMKQKPLVTSATLNAATQLIASYTTNLTDDVQRNKNIALACKAVNGTVLQPGDVFSFNKLTGERTGQKGYVEAPTIANKQLIDAPGGGVCQVSTTIYSAAILTGADIVERHHHSWPVFYAPAGQDSTVDYGRKDFRFQNNSSKALYLVVKADLNAKTVIAEFYGMPAEESIQIDVQNVESIQPDREIEKKNPKKNIGYRQVITEAHNGCRVKVYRVFYKNSAETRRELVSEDYYAPIQGVTEVGSKVPPGGDPNGRK